MNQKVLNKIFIWGFLFLYLLVACISFCHAVQFFNIGNVQWMSITLAFAFELGLALSLAAILLSDSNKSHTLPWILMIVLCFVQVVGNVYSTFKYISLSEFNYYQYLAKPLLFWIEEISEETVQIIISWIMGAILPIIALFMTDMVANNLKDMDNNESKIEQSIENEKNESNSKNDINKLSVINESKDLNETKNNTHSKEIYSAPTVKYIEEDKKEPEEEPKLEVVKQLDNEIDKQPNDVSTSAETDISDFKKEDSNKTSNNITDSISLEENKNDIVEDNKDVSNVNPNLEKTDEINEYKPITTPRNKTKFFQSLSDLVLNNKR